MEDVNFRLATERTQVIMYSNYGSRKYFGRKSFDEEFENILKRLKSIPSVECPFHFLYSICSPHPIIFSKIRP